MYSCPTRSGTPRDTKYPEGHNMIMWDSNTYINSTRLAVLPCVTLSDMKVWFSPSNSSQWSAGDNSLSEFKRALTKQYAMSRFSCETLSELGWQDTQKSHHLQIRGCSHNSPWARLLPKIWLTLNWKIQHNSLQMVCDVAAPRLLFIQAWSRKQLHKYQTVLPFASSSIG